MNIYNVVTTGYNDNEGYFTEVDSFKTRDEAVEHISKIRKVQLSLLVNDPYFDEYRILDDNPVHFTMHSCCPDYFECRIIVTTLEVEK